MNTVQRSFCQWKKVDVGYDCLKAVPIFPEDIEEVEAKTVSKEYQIYPLVIQWFTEERLNLKIIWRI